MLEIDPVYRPALAHLGLTTYEAVSREFWTHALPGRSGAFLLNHRLPGPDGKLMVVYYKHYKYLKPAWAFIGRPSKARREFENYRVFSRLGLPTPARIACGEQRDLLGRLKGAFIMTRAVPDAVTLWELFETRRSSLSPHVRRQLYRQLAVSSRRLHDTGFRHHDLFWRNLLVTWPASDTPLLWWIDCPRGSYIWRPLRERRRIRDLACYHRTAARFCSRTDRLRLILLYQGVARLDRPTKRLIRAVLAFGLRRWPNDWGTQEVQTDRGVPGD